MMPIRQIIMSDDVANEECLNPEDFLKERERACEMRDLPKKPTTGWQSDNVSVCRRHFDF